ncbi:carboxypeptidase regulatory-like domain-containing protein [uncultured Paludibaculum sp.]|uniref:carboxypeptidase regulatory-like domain-containing protein n=1 Tax=uncultured Paludibaculum sp. TaxID=1765020 RepID=UPI002AAA6EE1|nr:carboxypeptidase regulatory-like domain-containing protein [uncultured Paludibaculum sp.]
MTRLLLAGFLALRALAAQSSSNVGSVDGLVVNSLTSAPIRKAIVSLSQPVGPIHLSADTDPAGQFQFTGLPAGVYQLSANRAGYLPRPTGITVTLGSAGRATAPAIRLRPQGVISGRVLEDDAEPAPGATVFVYRQVYRTGRKRWERLNAAAPANEAGEYRVGNLTPGTYLLQALNQRRQANSHYGDPAQTGLRPSFFIPVYHPNSPTQESATAVQVGVGAEVGGIDIRLIKVTRPPSVHVKGKVTGVPGGPQTGVSVGLFPREEGVPGGSNVEANGPDYAFDLSVPPGDYEIRANVYSGGPEAYGSGTLSVAGDVEGVVVAVSPAPVVTGRILLAEPGGQVNLKGIRVLILDSTSSDGDFVRADAAGRFVLPSRLRPGRYALVVLGPLPAGYYTRAVKLGGEEITPESFEITASAQLEIILSKTAGTITVSVTNDQGAPVPVGVVTLIPEDARAQMEKGALDDRGQVQFTSLRPGKYKLHAWQEMEDDLWQGPEFRKQYDARAAEVTVGPSETQSAQLRVIPEAAIQ